MGKIVNETRTFLKAQITAQIATITDFVVSVTLAEGFGLWYVWSSFLGALTGGIVNCSMNYRWVFKTSGMKKRQILIRYFLVWAGSIGLNTLGTYLLTEMSSWHFIYAKTAVAIIVGILWNYLLQRNFVYKKRTVIENQ